MKLRTHYRSVPCRLKTEAEDVSEEVNGVACFVLFGPSPVMVFDEKAGMVC